MGYILFTEINDEICNKINGTLSISIGSFIILTIFTTYLPQYYKIIKSKSTEGISNHYIFLGNVSNFTNFYGTLLLNYTIVDCCNYVSAGDCANILLPIYQMFSPWGAIFIMYIIYIYYDKSDQNGIKKSLIYFVWFIAVFIFLFGIVGMALILRYNNFKNNINAFGNFLNILSTISCVVYMLPQIVMTYKNKSIGNLSLISLGFQAPGSLLVFIYQNIVSKAPISIGIPYFFSFIFQTILLVMGLYYERKKRRSVVYGPI